MNRLVYYRNTLLKYLILQMYHKSRPDGSSLFPEFNVAYNKSMVCMNISPKDPEIHFDCNECFNVL